MFLEGSCHCQSVRFSCESHHPLPYQRCYCSICRKTGGGGGFIVNTEADASTLKIEGKENVYVYRALIEREGEKVESKHERHFCKKCGSHLWAFNSNWPELLHPVAGAIDTELAMPPEYVHLLIDEDSRSSWVAVEGTEKDGRFPGYPDESIANWHRARGLEVD
jgi:hypothetical protein